MNKQYITAEVKKEGEKIVFIASDETLDRHGEVIPLESWDLTKYKANPVLLVNHDYQVQNVVGIAKNVKISEVKAGKKALTFEPVFHEITELAREVKQMVIDGVLKTVSVGFLRRGPEGDGERESNELMEISFVPVPANPGAHVLSTLAAKAVEEKEKEEIEKFLGDVSEPTINEPIDETEIKEGRVLSGKNRKAIQEAVKSGKAAIEALEVLLEATDPNAEREVAENTENANVNNNNPVPGEEKRKDTPESGKSQRRKGRAEGNRDVRILKRVAQIVNRELYQAKRS